MFEVMQNGSKFWHMKVRQANGKESRLTFGSYPEMTLAGARAERSKAKQQKAAGPDPAQSTRIEKLQKRTAAVNTFEALAREWDANKSETWKENTATEALARLENDVFPNIGKSPITDVDAPLMLDVLRQIEKCGAVNMAGRVAAYCSSVFRFAIAKCIVKYNPIPDLSGALRPRIKGNHAAIGTDELPDFLVALRRVEAGMFLPTRIMMRLMLLVFVRTSELIETPWSEIDPGNET